MEKEKHIHKVKNISNILLGVLFMLMLILPFAQKHFELFPDIASNEKRQLASMPEFDITSLDGFPGRYEKFYNDHFSFRSRMIMMKSIFSLVLFNVSPDPDKVIIGKNNWLFMVSDELETYRGTDLLNNEQLDTIRLALNNRKQYFRKQNIKVYFVIVPTKYTVYPENLPFYVDKFRGENRTDQVKELLLNLDIPTIDLREALIYKKSDKPLFRKADNHWNDLGAFYGTQIILDSIKKDFPQIDLPSLNDYKLEERKTSIGNLSAMINMQDYFPEMMVTLESNQLTDAVEIPKYGFPVPTKFGLSKHYEMCYSTKNDSLPDILVFRDSFGNAMIPFLKESFDTSIFIFDKWRYQLNPQIIEDVDPDIVVYAILESLLEKGLLRGIREEQESLKKLNLQTLQ